MIRNSIKKICDLVARSAPLRGRYGGLAGLRIALGLRRASYAGELGSVVTMRLPGFKQPVYLRALTSDADVFSQVLGDAKPTFGASSLRNPKWIVDAGANIGLTSILLAKQFPTAKILALEVEPSNFSLLCRNTASYSSIIPVHCGLWSRRTHLKIINPEKAKWSFSVREVATLDDETILALGVADILDEYGIDVIDLLKLDIEGAEREVLSNGIVDKWIDRVRVIAVELHERKQPGCEAALKDAIYGRDFIVQHEGEYVTLVRASLSQDHPHDASPLP